MKAKVSKFYERLCKGLCERIPQKKREAKIFPMLTYAGVKENFDFWLGKRMILVLLAGLVGLLLPLTLGNYLQLFELSMELTLLAGLATGIVLAAITMVMFYLHIYYVIEGRASMVEGILPDFLLLVASNINAGMTPFASFRASARKEFGPLTEEIKIVSAKSLGTKSFSSALKQLSENIKSKILNETVSFFSQAMKSGGKLAKLLETSAVDLRQTQEMKKELLSSTRMYVIFVAFVIVVATPLLLAVAIQFLSMISSIQAQSQVGGAEEVASVAFLSSEMSITPEFMTNVSYILLFGNALLASLFIGVLGEGKAKMGLKYAPVIFIASFAVLIISNGFLGQFLGIG